MNIYGIQLYMPASGNQYQITGWQTGSYLMITWTDNLGNVQIDTVSDQNAAVALLQQIAVQQRYGNGTIVSITIEGQ